MILTYYCFYYKYLQPTNMSTDISYLLSRIFTINILGVIFQNFEQIQRCCMATQLLVLDKIVWMALFKMFILQDFKPK